MATAGLSGTGARVDADGILLSMPADCETVGRLAWASEPTPSARNVEGDEQSICVYSSLKISDDTVNDTVSVGDVVYLHPEQVNMPCEVSRSAGSRRRIESSDVFDAHQISQRLVVPR
jgi:hypothetical protein